MAIPRPFGWLSAVMSTGEKSVALTSALSARALASATASASDLKSYTFLVPSPSAYRSPQTRETDSSPSDRQERNIDRIALRFMSRVGMTGMTSTPSSSFRIAAV